MRQRTSTADLRHPETDDAWKAVLARDGSQDGRFVYAVSTTGVFCRPSCGSRRPLRRNVRFFASAAEAAQSGFRACKRCRPTGVDATATLAATVRGLIDAAGDRATTLQALARETGATVTRIQRSFKRVTGLSPREYQDARRGERLRRHLRAGDSVTRATIEAGYGSTSRLHHRAGEVLGMTPNAFRDKGKGMHIRFGTTMTPLGALMVAFTERGVCSVALGDNGRDLELRLRGQFSNAEIEAAGAEAREHIASVVGTLDGTRDATIPLDLAGTEFQLLVWRALQRIPRGETRSYSELAASVGRPTATRAVASACARNNVAIVVPCHRVIREDGALGGYRWGIERKRQLLDREASDPNLRSSGTVRPGEHSHHPGHFMRALISRSCLLVLFAASSASAQRDTAFTWSKRLADGARLTIKNLSGPIDVRAASGDRVEVRATVRVESRGNASDVTFDVRERAADDVEICTVYRGKSDCDSGNSWNDIRVSVRYIVELPKTMRLRANTGNGDISVTQTVAEVDAATGNGDVVVRESMGRVGVSTGNGDVTITAAKGAVKVSSGNGRIIANTTRGPVEASTGNGDIDVKMATLPAEQGAMTFSTGSGSVRVTLPADFNGEVDARTGNGSITSDFELRVQGRLSTSRLRGIVGNGNGPVIKITSGNGRLELRKY